MKKIVLGLIVVIPVALFARVAYLILLAPAPDAAAMDHSFRQAAYTITWAIQLGYVAWLITKWQSQK